MNTLVRRHLEIFHPNRRDTNDKRKKVAWAVFSYIEQGTGYEYRKSFTAKVGTKESEFFNIAPLTINH